MEEKEELKLASGLGSATGEEWFRISLLVERRQRKRRGRKVLWSARCFCGVGDREKRDQGAEIFGFLHIMLYKKIKKTI